MTYNNATSNEYCSLTLLCPFLLSLGSCRLEKIYSYTCVLFNLAIIDITRSNETVVKALCFCLYWLSSIAISMSIDVRMPRHNPQVWVDTTC